jgi:hypothetical protein
MPVLVVFLLYVLHVTVKRILLEDNVCRERIVVDVFEFTCLLCTLLLQGKISFY